MLRLVRAVMLAAALVWLGAGTAAAQDPAADTGADDTTVLQDAPKARKAPGPPGRPGGGDADTPAWWNESRLVEELSLTAEQRAKMDARLEAFRNAVPPEATRSDFNTALQAGSWDGAHAELERLAESAAASVRTRGELKIGVLQILTEEQRKLVVDRYPRLIHRPWGRIMRAGPE